MHKSYWIVLIVLLQLFSVSPQNPQFAPINQLEIEGCIEQQGNQCADCDDSYYLDEFGNCLDIAFILRQEQDLLPSFGTQQEAIDLTDYVEESFGTNARIAHEFNLLNYQFLDQYQVYQGSKIELTLGTFNVLYYRNQDNNIVIMTVTDCSGSIREISKYINFAAVQDPVAIIRNSLIQNQNYQIFDVVSDNESSEVQFFIRHKDDGDFKKGTFSLPSNNVQFSEPFPGQAFIKGVKQKLPNRNQRNFQKSSVYEDIAVFQYEDLTISVSLQGCILRANQPVYRENSFGDYNLDENFLRNYQIAKEESLYEDLPPIKNVVTNRVGDQTLYAIELQQEIQEFPFSINLNVRQDSPPFFSNYTVNGQPVEQELREMFDFFDEIEDQIEPPEIPIGDIFCMQVSLTSQDCQKCFDGFELRSDRCVDENCVRFEGQNCSICRPGYRPDKKLCKQIARKSKICKQGARGVCTSCYLDHKLYDGSCWIIETPPGCLDFDWFGYARCNECADGHYVVDGVCNKLPLGCQPDSFNPFTQLCSHCKDGFLQSEGKCVQISRASGCTIIIQNECLSCVDDKFPFNGQCIEEVCQQNEIKKENGRCECRPGFFLEKTFNICEAIPDCPENSDFQVDTGRCFCSRGFMMNIFGRCIPEIEINCKINEEFINEKCQCLPGFFRSVNTFCYKIPPCPQNSIFNTLTTTCECEQGFYQTVDRICVLIPDCGENKQFNRQTRRCQCVQGFIQSPNGLCYRLLNCPDNEYFEPQIGQCLCNIGYLRVGLNCEKRCGTNEEWVDGQCVCIGSTIRTNGGCRQCPDDSSPNNGRTNCTCFNFRDVFNYSSFQCKQCPQNSSPNSQQSQCVCNQGYQVDPTTGRCEVICPENSTPNQAGTCICNQGFYMDQGDCKPIPTCPFEAVWDSQELRCKCVDLFKEIVDGQCLQSYSCGPNEVDLGNGRCECQPGFSRDKNNFCQKNCDQNQFWDGSQCRCSNGFYRTSNSLCERIPDCPTNSIFSVVSGRCQCNPGLKLDNSGRCIPVSQFTCKINEIQINGRCECLPGFYRRTNTFCYQIQSCPQNLVFNTATEMCECESGFIHNADGICIPLPICPQNRIYNVTTATCECEQGCYQTVDRICVLIPDCGENKQFNRQIRRCQCVQGFIQSLNGLCYRPLNCPDNEYFEPLIGQCLCKLGYFRIGLNCQKRCGANEEWMNGQCVCIGSTVRINGGCRQIPL